MHSLLFPTTIVDNFLLDPDQFLNLASNQKYYLDKEGRWPGVRTKNLVEYYPYLIHNLVGKILSLYYNLKQEELTWNVSAFFQKVTSSYSKGWIHSDDSQLSIIIYLCKEGLGTSIYKPNDISTFKGVIHREKKIASYKEPLKLNEYSVFRDENNNQFKKVISVDSCFNRLLCFEGGQFHGVDNFIDSNDKDERLTMVMFINNISSTINFPIHRSKFCII